MQNALHYAEISLVSGGVKGDPSCIEQLRRMEPTVFQDFQLQAVVGAILEVDSQGLKPSLERVVAQLLRSGKLGEASASYVSEITDVPGTLDAEARAAEIVDAFQSRGIIRGAKDWLSSAEGKSPEELRAAFSDLFQDIPSNSAAKPLPAITLSENWLSEEVAPREFALGSAAPLGAVTLLSAQGGAGKSTLLLQVSMGLACGREFMPGWKASTPARVLFVALEDESLEIRRRMQRVAFAFNVTEHEAELIAQNLVIVPLSRPDFFRMGPTRGIELGTHFKALEATLTDGDYRLCVIDPVAALLAGCVEENSNEAAQFVIGRLNSILPQRTALLLAAHVAKVDRELATSPRGAGAWSDAARQAWGMRPVSTKETADLPHAVLPGDVVVLHATKSNYSRLAHPIFLVRSQCPESAGALLFLDVEATTASRAKAEAERLTKAIQNTLQEHRCTVGELSGKHGTHDALSYASNVRALIAEEADQKVTVRVLAARLKEMITEGLLTDELDPASGRKILIPAQRRDTGTKPGQGHRPGRDTGTKAPLGGLVPPCPETHGESQLQTRGTT